MSELETISAERLRCKQIPPIKWILPDILPEGLTILAGAPKAGKSWLALDLCLSVAAQRPMWGKMPAVQGDVLYCALEDSDRRIQDRFSQLWNTDSTRGELWPSNLYFAYKLDALDGDIMQQLRKWFDEHPQTKLIVIDTLGRIRKPVKNESYNKDYNDLAAVKSIADATGCAVVVVHHLRKMYSTDPFDRISGTQGILGAADTAWILTRERKTTDGKLAITGRDVEEAEFALRFGDCRWELMSEDAENYDLMQNPVLRFVAQIPDCTQKSAESFSRDYEHFCNKAGIQSGLTTKRPDIAFSRKWNAVISDFWRVGKTATKLHTRIGTEYLITDAV